MTVQDTSIVEVYSGNGVNTTFTLPFGTEYFAESEIYVLVRSTAGSETAPTFSVSSSTIILTNATPATGEKVLVKRVLPITQEVDYTANGSLGSFKASTHEEALDRAVMLIGQLDEAIDRSVKLQQSILPASFDPTLPSDIASGGAGLFLLVNTAGTGFAPMADSIGVTDVEAVTAYATSAASSATAAASSASAASASATTAAGSATAAAVSAATAAGSAVAALSSATLAGSYLTIVQSGFSAVQDSILAIVDETDASKRTVFALQNASTASTLTHNFLHAADRTITYRDATDTIVYKALAETLTNKVIDADANTLSNIENADIKAAAAIAVNKLAASTPNLVAGFDSSGFLTALNFSAANLTNAVTPQGCIAYSTSTATVSTTQPVIYGTEVYDPSNILNNATGVVTIQKAGRYLAEGWFYAAAGTPRLYQDSLHRFQGLPGSASSISKVSGIVNCTVGTTLEIRGDSTLTMANNSLVSHLMVYFLGE